MTLPIRTATVADLEQMLEWAAREGWNPGWRDAALFHAADPGGFFLAEDERGMAGCISAVRYGASFGFIGFYIARPDRRGQGVGIALWRRGMAHLEGRVVGLDGVVAQQENYRRSGFELAWRNVRYAAARPRAVTGESGEVREASAVAPEVLAALDATVFPAPRLAFMRAWLSAPGHKARVVMRHGEAVGFGVLRPCRDGAKIGPLTACGAGAARALFNALIEGAEGPVSLDLPQPNPAAIALAVEAGMAPVFETARMYAGAAPALQRERIFGVTSFELG